MTYQTLALVVAAGRGSRSGADKPKQYCALGGKPLVRWSLERLASHPAIDAVRVVIHPDDADAFRLAADGLDVGTPIHGGATRQESVRLGLEAIAAEGGAARVLIHDAARPFVTHDLIDRLLAALDAAPGATPALPVVDTLCRDAGTLEADGAGALPVQGEAVARDGLWRVQTPQGFRFDPLLAAHRAAFAAGDARFTDDAGLLRAHGHAVVLVPGAETNIKVTLPQDWQRAGEILMSMSSIRTGSGYDVHRFADGDHVWLCGIKVPHTRALAGHSDADVALHALTDAILGAIAAGDIGQHFPPSDPQWKGAASWKFLDHARALVEARGGVIEHVDVTLICERPKVGPHRAAMTARIAEILRLPADRISVKATTTEGLGFTGRQEGIAAQAMATVRLPVA
ncbi:bifunctional 2-C-methyl-D-erythritol 4-phosphate cytidylyltransferase/2-C-methyl-D-erythritol 2,4-cyclodiphosphate synthase [Pedomonas sp. V897]|uniref:bifunctional 2-C-methyl-D-erythritol 4-phosphate cytidylyltransferase/2-C-methyl-D-erythritol 2,4-cyclodiphosphate synthase n=1 Tax=Pedomonas sp. V897 TaxID=3446482 RepID=UPI003EE2E4B2